MPHLEAMQAAAGGVDPQGFQDALASCSEVLIAEAMKNIHPPRSVGELSRMSEMHRKAAGLDGRHASGRHQFIRPLRSLRRRPVVDVPVDPLGGFEI